MNQSEARLAYDTRLCRQSLLLSSALKAPCLAQRQATVRICLERHVGQIVLACATLILFILYCCQKLHVQQRLHIYLHMSAW